MKESTTLAEFVHIERLSITLKMSLKKISQRQHTLALHLEARTLYSLSLYHTSVLDFFQVSSIEYRSGMVPDTNT